MKGMKAPSVSNTLWAKGLDRLMKACGWNYHEGGRQFGLHGRKLIEIRYHGVKPQKATRFMLQMRKLETVYAEDLRALECGAIEFRNGERIDWRVKGAGKFDRPNDLRTLGAVDRSGPVRRLASEQRSTSGMGDAVVGGGNETGGYPAHGSGQPEVIERGSGVSVEGVS